MLTRNCAWAGQLALRTLMPAALVLALACAATLPEALLPDLASERAASSRARATCAAIPFSEPTAQLTPGVNELGLRCEPPGGGPPCVLEPFFSRVGNSSEHARNLAQCVARKRDEDWPIYEPYARRTTATKTVVDVQGLLGGRSVTIIGASVAAQLRAAVHCALASAGLERDTSRWQHWGWAMFARDNRGCAGNVPFKKVELMPEYRRDKAGWLHRPSQLHARRRPASKGTQRLFGHHRCLQPRALRHEFFLGGERGSAVGKGLACSRTTAAT
mmetsp:Transcript_7990/g.20563  ORF Transcript_7990/g.20563 Transcript_7990/m.20563 type:complete len:274 (+) Transcript_7990:92-913(+)